jgi:hypothetical protein
MRHRTPKCQRVCQQYSWPVILVTVRRVRRCCGMTIIFLAYRLPDPISDELARQGHSVYECLAISEVFALTQEHFDAQIIIAADMEEK